MEGGACSEFGSRLSAAHIRCNSSQQFQGLVWLMPQKRCFGMISECQGAAVTLVRGVEVSGRVLWRESGSSRPNGNGGSCA
eukprot:2367638-Pyramimonas_sp.AAC.1